MINWIQNMDKRWMHRWKKLMENGWRKREWIKFGSLWLLNDCLYGFMVKRYLNYFLFGWTNTTVTFYFHINKVERNWISLMSSWRRRERNLLQIYFIKLLTIISMSIIVPTIKNIWKNPTFTVEDFV